MGDSRTQSIASSSLLTVEDANYDNVDVNKLYEAVLKILILEYRNEARFRTPIQEKSPVSSNLEASNSSSMLSSSSAPSAKNKHNEEVSLPSHLIASLEKRLNLIALKKSDQNIDEMTRRSLLRFYSEVLDPRFKEEVKRVNKPEYLVMKFVSSADKELVKIGSVPSNEISSHVFKQTGVFVQILISLVRQDRNCEQIVAKLKEYKESLKPKAGPIASSASKSTSTATGSLKYPNPSFRVADMEQAMINLVSKIFNVDKIKIQQDVFKVKDLAQEKTLHKDVQQIQFYLSKDLGQLTARLFLEPQFYEDWKAREESLCSQLLNKYQIPAAVKLLPTPLLPSGEDFYILPTTQLSRSYFVVLLKKCIEYEKQEKQGISNEDSSPSSLLESDSSRLFSKHVLALISHCSKFWRIDFPTRATSLYTAAHATGILKDNLGLIDLSMTGTVLHFCKRVIEDLGKLDWDDKFSWSMKDQELWTKNLLISYNEALLGIKESLGLIFNKHVKPKFGPYLQFLGDYIESDSLFNKVEETGIVKKWEKKLSKTLLRVSEAKYADLLANLPRDDTLNIVHILNISDSIVDDIRALQKRYKNPLLGFLNVPRTSAAVITGMFASDSRNILKHINAYSKQKNEPLPYGDAIEAYKSLFQIRDIFNQVSYSNGKSTNGGKVGPGNVFKFDLEDFFYPFLEEWVSESGEKIRSIITEAISRDDFKPIDIENDSKKYSSSVLDIFVLVREYLKILKNLNWSNEFQAAKIYTNLLKSISEGVLAYASKITDKIIKELDEEESRREKNGAGSNTLDVPQVDIEKRKSGGWFDEVKNVVSNIQSGQNAKFENEEPYNFKPETCIALNNLSAMMEQMTKLEDHLDPESISKTVMAYDPNVNKKFTSHVFSVRIVKAENIKLSSSSSNLHPYITLIDTKLRKTIAKTGVVHNSDNPEWDEEFEITIPANTSLTISSTVWDQPKFGTHSICGRALLQLDPRNFKHDGIPQEIYLDLDTQGRVLLEVAVESERADAIFAMGRAHRSLKRSQERCIKLIVQKFSRFIHYCFSRSNLKSICGSNGNIKPTQDQMDQAMMPLYNYLNLNLETLAQYLTNELLMKVMIAAWLVVIASADGLLLPKLTSAKTFNISSFGSKLTPSSVNLLNAGGSNGNSTGWQSSLTTAMVNVGNSIGISGFGKLLTNPELETVFSWLNFLCLDFFHNGGNGPSVKDLKNLQYQTLLLLPVYYDGDVEFLTQEVERLSPAFIQSLRDRNNFDNFQNKDKLPKRRGSLGRAGTLVRSNTIGANATAKARAKAVQEVQEANLDPISAQTAAEDVILRVLLIKGEKGFVARRLEQRERLAHSISTERLARAAAEGALKR